ncbi:MAG: tetratricopeptide repeat protein [Acidobacteria bacterium]|nr:tetratricopeptide repeat protein [Acidobacteriota bacterium]MCY3965540.1 tetratricopeptide repeat protein [Acidobacteriota bacterium]
MNAKNTLSRAKSLVPCLLLLGSVALCAALLSGESSVEAQIGGAVAKADPDLERAIEEQRRLVQSQSRPAARATALNDLANLLELRGDVTAALESYRAAIAADGTWAPAHYNLGLLAYTTGDMELASSHLATAIELAPENAWAHYQLGRIADDAGASEKAVRHYVRAVSLDSRLAFDDVNPHFAVNRHATEILLRADRTNVSALPPRTYSDPGRISGLLIPAHAPPAPEAAAEEATEAAEVTGAAEVTETTESDGSGRDRVHGYRAPAATGTEGSEPSATATAPLPVSSPEDERASIPADLPRAAETAAEREPRVFTREDLRSRTLASGGVTRVPVGTPAPSTSPAAGRRGAIQVGTPVGPGGRQPEPLPSPGTLGGSSGGRFQPTFRSSAQLDTTIRRLPVPAP